jgi:UDP-N-acetylglucosamine acyltransferase
MRIGRLAMVRGGCRFSKDIAPFLVGSGENNVAGLNVVGLRRAGLGAGLRAELKRAFLLLYASGLNVTQAVAAASQEEWGPEARAFWDFVAGSAKRGLCDYVGRDGAED